MGAGIGRRVAVRGLTEGAILAAIVALFALLVRYVPLIALIAPLVCPLPLTVLAIRHGIRIALLAALVAVVVGILIAGPLAGLLIASTFAPLGISMGIAVRRRLSAPLIILATGITVICVLLLNVVLTRAISGVNPLTAGFDQMRQSQDEFARFYQRIGLFSHQQTTAASAAFKDALEMAPRLLAAFVILGGFSVAWLNYVVGSRVLRRVGILLPALPPIATWRVPPDFLWLYPAAAGLGLVMARVPTVRAAGELVSINLMFMMQVLFLAQGAIVGWVLMNKYGVPRAVSWIFVVLAMTNPAVAFVAFAIGIAEAAFRLRRRWMTVSTETSGVS